MTDEELLQVIEQAAEEGAPELDLSGNNLTALPPEIGKLTQLLHSYLDKIGTEAPIIAMVNSSPNKLFLLVNKDWSLSSIDDLSLLMPMKIHKSFIGVIQTDTQ